MSIDQFSTTLRDMVRRNLHAFDRRVITNHELKTAAVAITISKNSTDDRPVFLLTRRATRLSRHSGQYALPGGRIDEGESATQAALRELHEEVNIDLKPDAVLGLLDDYQTRSGYHITPIVVWCDDLTDLLANPDEVAKVFHIPLLDISAAGNPLIQSIPESQRPVLSLSLPTIGHEIYSPTAAVLHQFHEVALAGRSTRVADYEQPVFAWR